MQEESELETHRTELSGTVRVRGTMLELVEQIIDSATEPRDGEGSERVDERRFLIEHREGDDGAFARLVAAYRAPVYGHLCRCAVPEADRDDLFQEIFLRVHRAAASYDERRPLHPWLFTIVANAVRNHFRRQRVRELVAREPEEVEAIDPSPDGERRATSRETASWVAERIQSLPLKQRQVLLLASVENLPMQEIAKALEMPLNTVKSSLRRARRALMRDLSRREQGEVTP